MGQAAEIMGTVVSTDPAANTIVVRSADGRETVYRTTETTTIQQGGTAVRLQAVQPGTQVQVMADPTTTPAPAAGTTTIVYPVASGIVLMPTNAAPAPARAGGDTETERDVDVDIEEKHESDDD
ncbi:MAG: hypothetical protein DCC71_04615 [Proteobacteria bacterium]|nr:MAG: hypothetical protein DCC71_04615 [Pseudomonadota bacterium]